MDITNETATVTNLRDVYQKMLGNTIAEVKRKKDQLYLSGHVRGFHDLLQQHRREDDKFSNLVQNLAVSELIPLLKQLNQASQTFLVDAINIFKPIEGQ